MLTQPFRHFGHVQGKFYLELIFFPPWRNSPRWATIFSLSRLHDHTQTQHTQ